MIGPCPACGQDPGFNWAQCPACGHRASPPPNDAAMDDGRSNMGRWDDTINNPGAAAPRERARFGPDTGDFYRPVGGPPPAAGLAFGSPDPPTEAAGYTWGSPEPGLKGNYSAQPFGGNGGGTSDATIMDRGGGPAYFETSDHTVIEHGGRIGFDEPASDHTVIVRDGQRGHRGPLVYLVERNGIRAGKVHLIGEEVGIGRGADNDVVLGNETVSKRHGRIRVEDGTFMYWDLASANYSFLVKRDGSRERILAPHPLQDGDTIELGEARVTYLEVDRGQGE